MDQLEWLDIVERHTPLVWKTAYRLLGHHADCNDCFQETFVSAWEVASRQPVKNWPGLLTHLATARSLDLLRRKRRRNKHINHAADPDQVFSTRGEPSIAAQNVELATQLRTALSALPDQLSKTYCLRHLSGMTYEQIAAELNITVSAVGVNLHRATSRLRAALAPTIATQPTRGET